MERLVAQLLRVGVLLAAAVTRVGAIAVLFQQRSTDADYRTFTPGPAELRSVAGIFRGALHLHSGAIVQLGLLLLIATPIARVLLTLVAFVLRRDRLYTVVTTLGLAVLLYSLLFSGA